MNEHDELLEELTTCLREAIDYYGDGDAGLEAAMRDGMDAWLVGARALVVKAEALIAPVFHERDENEEIIGNCTDDAQQAD